MHPGYFQVIADPVSTCVQEIFEFTPAHLPRFVIYNGLNAWGKHREVPHPAKHTFHSWHQANRGDRL